MQQLAIIKRHNKGIKVHLDELGDAVNTGFLFFSVTGLRSRSMMRRKIFQVKQQSITQAENNGLKHQFRNFAVAKAYQALMSLRRG